VRGVIRSFQNCQDAAPEAPRRTGTDACQRGAASGELAMVAEVDRARSVPHSPNASHVYREIGRGHRRGREMIFTEKTLLPI
jgi:hypothetical protein